jgi:CPA2 family monovalent cation:H+ antiporter-2
VFRLPLPLAAFLGGAATGDSPETAEVRDHLRPFRELFAALFFVALPTLIDPSGLRGALGWLALLLAVLAIAKVGLVAALARVARLPGVRPVQLAVGLGQTGEFSCAIAVVAREHGALPADVYEGFLGAMAVSIAVTAILVRLGGARSPRSSRRTAGPPGAG